LVQNSNEVIKIRLSEKVYDSRRYAKYSIDDLDNTPKANSILSLLILDQELKHVLNHTFWVTVDVVLLLDNITGPAELLMSSTR
jgi:hypothetical protein